jgi:hypothetical protein
MVSIAKTSLMRQWAPGIQQMKPKIAELEAKVADLTAKNAELTQKQDPEHQAEKRPPAKRQMTRQASKPMTSYGSSRKMNDKIETTDSNFAVGTKGGSNFLEVHKKGITQAQVKDLLELALALEPDFYETGYQSCFFTSLVLAKSNSEMIGSGEDWKTGDFRRDLVDPSKRSADSKMGHYLQWDSKATWNNKALGRVIDALADLGHNQLTHLLTKCVVHDHQNVIGRCSVLRMHNDKPVLNLSGAGPKTPVVFVGATAYAIIFVHHGEGFQEKAYPSGYEELVLNNMDPEALPAAAKCIWKKPKNQYSSTVILPGDMVVFGCAFSTTHQVVMPIATEARKVLVFSPHGDVEGDTDTRWYYSSTFKELPGRPSLGRSSSSSSSSSSEQQL